MKTLSVNEMKKISGGFTGELPPECTHPSDCPSGINWDCVPGYDSYACENGRCKIVICS